MATCRRNITLVNHLHVTLYHTIHSPSKVAHELVQVVCHLQALQYEQMRNIQIKRLFPIVTEMDMKLKCTVKGQSGKKN